MRRSHLHIPTASTQEKYPSVTITEEKKKSFVAARN
jgi:hypothetical protein